MVLGCRMICCSEGIVGFGDILVKRSGHDGGGEVEDTLIC